MEDNKIILTCLNCNKNYERYKSYYEKIKNKEECFCTRKCMFEYKNKAVKKHNFTCLNCKNEFTRTDREVKNQMSKGHEIKFCSRTCKDEYRTVTNTTQMQCDYCNKLFQKPLNKVSNNNYCSDICYQLSKGNIYNGKADYMTLVCKECGEDFKVKTSYYRKQLKNNQDVKYCSKKCMTQSIRINMVETQCCICNKRFFKNKNGLNHKSDECCSLKCRKEYLKKYHVFEVTCAYCGNKFSVNKYRYEHSKKYFCNNNCFLESKRKTKLMYKDISAYLRTCQNYITWRNSVIEKAGYKCETCGSQEELHAHHMYNLYNICKDYDFDVDIIKESNVFNDISNGKCLCEKCHLDIHKHMLKRDDKGRYCRLRSKLQEALDD